ncbi:class I SAM-dependent DNA methyltransferase [Leucobacter sp. GX24907]
MRRHDSPSSSRTTPKYSHLWDRLRSENPEHSANYAQRWRNLAAEGHDLDGEARFAMALVAPGATVLDAGCGQGRVGGYLSERGYAVTGVDLDDVLIAEARSAFPSAAWHIGDLATFDYSGELRTAAGETGDAEADLPGGAGVDLAISAGNVLTFLDPAARRPALEGLRSVLSSEGRIVTGFGLDRGYELDDYLADLAAVGLIVQHRFSSWDLLPFEPHRSGFLVCVSTLAPHP